jgi:hypothetical protein
MSRLASWRVVAAASLVAACGSLELRPTPETASDWAQAGSLGSFNWFGGDVALDFGGARNFAPGEFPIAGAVENRSPSPIRVVVRRTAADGALLGARQTAPRSKEYAAVVSGESFPVESGARVLLRLSADRSWTDDEPKTSGDTVTYAFEFETPSGSSTHALRMVVRRRINDMDRWWDPIWVAPLAPLLIAYYVFMWVFDLPTC